MGELSKLFFVCVPSTLFFIVGVTSCAKKKPKEKKQTIATGEREEESFRLAFLSSTTTHSRDCEVKEALVSIMSRVLLVLLTYDDPECGGAADAFVEHVQRDAAMLESRCQLSVKPLQVVTNGSHRDALYGALQDVFQVKPSDIYVISFLKSAQFEEYRKVRELCIGVKPVPLKCQVLTHLSNYTDVGLIIRNLVRLVIEEMSRNVDGGDR